MYRACRPCGRVIGAQVILLRRNTPSALFACVNVDPDIDILLTARFLLSALCYSVWSCSVCRFGWRNMFRGEL